MNTTYTCGILTLSDKGSRGEREDTSGPLLQKILTEQGFKVIAYKILPDQQDQIEARLIQWVDHEKVDLIITTGGTGISPTDRTPEATRRVIDLEIPGIAEAMRYTSSKAGLRIADKGRMQNCRGGFANRPYESLIFPLAR